MVRVPILCMGVDPPEKEMATHSSTLAWRIPWMEEPDGLQSWGRKELDKTELLHLTRFRWLPEIICIFKGQRPKKMLKLSVCQRKLTLDLRKH